MTGLVAARVLLIVVMIVAAHLIKPFSVRNITNHLLLSTRSFAFILPDSARDDFDHANYLARTLSKGLFDSQLTNQTEGSIQAAPQGMAFNLIAIQTSPVPELAVGQTVSPGRSVRPAIRSEAVKSEEVADEPAESDELIGSLPIAAEASEEVVAENDAQSEMSEVTAQQDLAPADSLSAVTPITLPAAPYNLNVALTKIRPIHLGLAQMRTECEKRELPSVKLIALIEAAKKLKTEVSFNEKLVLSILDCDETGTEVEETNQTESTGPEVEMTVPFLNTCLFNRQD